MKKIEAVMEILNYNGKWLEYKLIDEEYVFTEYKRFIESEDKNTEHYRYGSFIRLLKTPGFFTDKKIKQYIELAILDKDQTMTISAIRDLICSKCLSEQQFVSLLDSIPANNPTLEKVYKREKLLRLLSSTINLTQEIFDLMFFTSDPVIHFALVGRNDLYYNQLLLLSTSGKNKSIRNLARILLNKSNKINA